MPEQLFFNTGIATYVWIFSNRKDRERKGAVHNPLPSSELEFKKVFKDKVDDQFDSDGKLWQQLMNNPELNKYIEKKMFRYVADKILALREE